MLKYQCSFLEMTFKPATTNDYQLSIVAWLEMPMSGLVFTNAKVRMKAHEVNNQEL